MMPIDRPSSDEDRRGADPRQPTRSGDIRVLLADDHDIVREGLRALLGPVRQM